MESARPDAEARGVALDVHLTRLPEPFSGDAIRLQQIATNLLSNAIKFSTRGGRVQVSLEATATEAVIRVEDDGPGITPAFLPYVFDRFRQADSSSTRPSGGLGLGLAIVRHLTELHGGSVEAANRKPGPGAVFTVRLPVRGLAQPLRLMDDSWSSCGSAPARPLAPAGADPRRHRDGEQELPAGRALPGDPEEAVALDAVLTLDEGALVEHPERAAYVVDRDPDTTWITESYSSGLDGANKAGVGIYVDAKPGVEAVRMEIQTPETGWRAEIFGATGGRVPESIESGWERLGGGLVKSDHQRFKLAASGERYRYYLVWITELPPDAQRKVLGENAIRFYGLAA